MATDRDSTDLEHASVVPRKVEKPWGWELIYALTDKYCGKVIFVRAGEELSLQYHREKDEVVFVYEGRVEFEMGEGDGRASEIVGPGRGFHLAPGTVHRWRALEDSLVLEVSTPQLDDVVRLKDRYGRADSK